MTEKLAQFPKAILFDMDGVLIDSLKAWWKAINLALDLAHYPQISIKKFTQHIWGNDFQESMKYLEIHEDIFSKNKEWVPIYLNHITLSENTLIILSELYKKYPLGIITNTQHHITDLVLEKFNLQSFFSTIVCADDVKKGKPSPDMILKTCDLLDVSVSEVIAIGDTKKDLLACEKAGCLMIGMNFQTRYEIKNLREIFFVLKNIQKSRDNSF